MVGGGCYMGIGTYSNAKQNVQLGAFSGAGGLHIGLVADAHPGRKADAVANHLRFSPRRAADHDAAQLDFPTASPGCIRLLAAWTESRLVVRICLFAAGADRAYHLLADHPAFMVLLLVTSSVDTFSKPVWSTGGYHPGFERWLDYRDATDRLFHRISGALHCPCGSIGSPVTLAAAQAMGKPGQHAGKHFPGGALLLVVSPAWLGESGI